MPPRARFSLHQSGIKSLFLSPRFVLALTGTRRLVVQIKAIEKDGLLPLGGLVVPAGPQSMAGAPASNMPPKPRFYLPQSGIIKSPFLRFQICTGAHRSPAACDTIQGE